MEWKPRLVLIGMSLILKKLSDIPILLQHLKLQTIAALNLLLQMNMEMT